MFLGLSVTKDWVFKKVLRVLYLGMDARLVKIERIGMKEVVLIKKVR